MIIVITVYSLITEVSMLTKEPSSLTFGTSFDFISID